jgi:hypothetical protein
VFKKAAGKGKDAGERGCMSLGHAISASRTLDAKSNMVKNVLKNGGPSMSQMMAELSRVFLQQFKDEDVMGACKKFFDRYVRSSLTGM